MNCNRPEWIIAFVFVWGEMWRNEDEKNAFKIQCLYSQIAEYGMEYDICLNVLCSLLFSVRKKNKVKKENDEWVTQDKPR